MAFWASHISFLPPSYACDGCERNPLILKFVAAFRAFQFAFHTSDDINDMRLRIYTDFERCGISLFKNPLYLGFVEISVI